MCCGLDMRPEVNRDVYLCSTCGRQMSGMEWAEFVSSMRWSMKQFAWWLGWLWSLPVTAAGVLFALVTCDHIAGPEMGAFVFRPRPWFRRAFFDKFHVAAFCWSQCVFAPDGLISNPTLRHELVHFKQARIFGIFLPLVYGVGSLVAWVKGGHPYRDCFLEKWAREESGNG